MKKRIRRCNVEKQRQWEEVMRRWQQSGQSVRQYCRLEGLRESAFYCWRRELARRSREASAVNGSRSQVRPAMPAVPSPTRGSLWRGPTPAFLPVQVVGPASGHSGLAEAAQGVEIILGQGRTVRVRSGFDRQALVDVLAVLEVRPC
jgi:hypothetical protein